MLILSIESTCDETACAVTRDGREILSDVILSQTDIHAAYGGVVPELASRAHVEAVSPLCAAALERAGVTRRDIDAVAVSYAPGLIGAVLVGVSFAKALALSLDVPLIPVHHIKGHIAANYLAFRDLTPPFLCVCVSGGNTLIADARGYTDIRTLGATVDDAAGECFDKAARVLGLGYPGGAAVDRLAQDGDDAKYPLPRASVSGKPFDMSFSGLKTAVVNTAHRLEQRGETIDKASLCACLCAAVSDTIVPRAMAALDACGYDKIVVAGGVAANSRIRRDLEAAALARGTSLYLPPLSLCGDNAAMIGAQGYYEYLAGVRADSGLNACATLEIDDTIRVTAHDDKS